MSLNSPVSAFSVHARHLNKYIETSDGILTILDDISFDINAGSTVAVVGSSGSGKTTLLGLLAGLDVACSGSIRIGDTELTTLDEDGRADLRSGNVGFVFQNFQLLNGLTALENVMLPLELAAKTDANHQACLLLDQVGLSHRVRHYPNQLSGGEQQRCAIARAFAMQPRLLFADEPTGNLDQVTGKIIIDLLFSLNQEQHTTLIMATHDNQLTSYCDQNIKLESGKILDD